MKKILFFYIVISSLFGYSQGEIQGGWPIKDLKPIRITEQEKQNYYINNSTSLISSQPTGNSTEVGLTEGQLSVNLSGAANYDIPINVPIGINGVVPKITINYNSQSGNGLAGYGWNISGLSVISRIPSTKFHDNNIDGVDFDLLDRFALDGQRLIVKNGTNGNYGNSGTVYETENYSNLTINSSGTHPSGTNFGPAFFEIRYPDGSFARYGSTTNSRTVNEWAITYWQNPQGVRISYFYENFNNSLSISKISYGTRWTEPGINEVEFVYKNRERKEHSFIGGQSILRSNILSQIKVKGNNVGFRNYFLDHDITSLGYERLISITERSGDNSISFNPTVFYYETTNNTGIFTPSSISSIDLNQINHEHHDIINGDFDGDGNMDLILFPKTGTNSSSKYWLFNNLNSSSLNVGWEHNIGKFKKIFPITWLSSNEKYMPMHGWCIIQSDASSNIISFKNFSAGTSNPIHFQYERQYNFPQHFYTINCPNYMHCDLTIQPRLEELDHNSTSLLPIINPDGKDRDPIIVDPVNRNCPNPTNLSIINLFNGEATLIWDIGGTPSPIKWEICYFNDEDQTAPSNDDIFGTYNIVSENSFVIPDFNPRKKYYFYIRPLCEDSNNEIIGNWVGPYFFNGMSEHNTVTKYVNIQKEFVCGDFNGDGLSDIIAIDKAASYELIICHDNCYTTSTQTIPGGQTYYVNLDRRLETNFVNPAGSIIFNSFSKLEVGDIDGDGKSDLIIFENGVIRVYSLNNFNQLTQIISYNDSGIKSDMPYYFGDFNGDGKLDFVIPQNINSDSWSFYLSTGNGFTKQTRSIGRAYRTTRLEWVGYPLQNQYLVEYSIIPSDFNNDGKTDLLFQENFTLHLSGDLIHGYSFSANNDPASTKFILLENKFVSGSQISFSIVDTPASNQGITRFPLPIFADRSKHLINDLKGNFEYGLVSGNKIKTFKITKDNRIDTLLKEIILGNGTKEVITYTDLNSECNQQYNCVSAYEPSSYQENYPNFDIKIANGFQVVSKIEQITSSSEYKRQNFRYYGAVVNFQGLGFLGFRGLLKTNWHNDEYPIISHISKHNINQRGAIEESKIVLGEYFNNFIDYPYTTFINKVTSVYEDTLLQNKVFKIKNVFSENSNGLDNTSIETTFEYDSLNNPTLINTKFKNNQTIEKTEDLVIEYYPPSFGTSYNVGRIKKKYTTLNYDGMTMTGEEIFTYNSIALISKIQKKGHFTNFLTEDNVYDIFGNITKKTITANGLPPRETEFTYDSSGRFLTSSQDVEGLITNYEYDQNFGFLLSESLPSNAGYQLKTSFLYDKWGKKVSEEDYLGKKTFTSYNWLNQSTNGRFSITTTGQDDSFAQIWFDELGRKIAQGYKTVNDSSVESNISWRTFEYDIYDRIIKSYEPILSFQPQWSGLISTSTYDEFGRIIQTIEFNGKTTNISYNGLTTITNDGVSNSTSVRNSFGNIISFTDNGGTISYYHFPNGNLKRSDFNGIITEIEQNGWGEKTKLIDPSAGVFEYEYNEFGELTKEITPKGITTLSLNNVGKLIEKTIIGSNGDITNNKTVFTYHPENKLLTNVRFDDYTEGFYTLYSYEYDNYKRLTLYEESGFNAYFQRAKQYDSFGRIWKEFYAAINTSDGKISSKWIKNTFKNGHHWQILDDQTNQILWQTTKVNSRGQLLNGLYGNGISVLNSYDQFGFPNQIKHDKTSNPASNIMTLITSFSPQRGNLIFRQNNLFDYREDYTYDNLDRLTSWRETGLTLCDCNFNNEIHGFESVNNSSVSLSNNQLTVSGSVGLGGKGTQKLVISNAEIGKKINIKGKLQIHTATSGTSVHISFYSKDPVTGETNGFETIGMPISNGSFSFGTTISSSNYEDLYVLFLMRNPSNPSAFMALSLDDIKITMEIEENQSYDEFGRIDENNVGSYSYSNSSKPFHNTAVNLNDMYSEYYLNRANLDISYNVFKSPVNIIEEGKDKLSFTYNMINSRSTLYYGGLEIDKMQRRYRKHYSFDGSMEIKQDIIEGSVEFITYIGGDAYSAPLVLKSDGTSQNYFYLHRDYLGSILAITDQTGNIVEKRLFDAWGNITKVEDGQGNNLNELIFFDRGFTGHEHLQSVVLVHMNGRLYDPVIHRFLQPDNNIQDPFYTQNYNRYGYGWNNPLTYSDPSGEWIWVAVAAVVGGVVNWATHGAQFNMNGLKAFGIGAAAGAIGAVTGGYAFAAAGGAAGGAGGFLAGAFGGAVGSLSGQTFLSVGNHVAFGDPLMSGKEMFIGASIGAVTGGSFQGLSALRNGRNFWTGKLPNPKVAPITLSSPVGVTDKGAAKPAEIKADANVNSPTQPTTSPTTQNNTATVINKETGYVDVSKNPGFAYKGDEVAKGGLSFNKGVAENFNKHAFAGGRHSDLGLSVETMTSKGMNLVESNLHLLKAGDNTLTGNINGIQKSFKAFVQNGKVMSVNMYPGVSNRVTQGTTINFGNVTW